MAEYFEITLFTRHKSADNHRQFRNLLTEYGLALGGNQIDRCPIELLNCQSVWVEVFEETDYDQYRFSFSDLHFTEEHFHETLAMILRFVDVCFCRIDDIGFATGIYELTYFLTEKINSIGDFDVDVLRQFPLVFWKGENVYALPGPICYKTISYAVNSGKGTQDIFSDF